MAAGFNIGNVAVNAAIQIPFSTFGASGASLQRTTAGSVRIYKDGSTTERSSSSGIVDNGVTGYDSVTGLNLVTIDLSDNTDAGFYAAGHNYYVMINGAVIDSQTVNLWIGMFTIDNRMATADVTKWNSTAVSSPATAGIPDVNVKNMNNVAATSITAVNANQGTTQPVNFTGTGASALAKADMVDIAGAAVNTANAQIGANVVSYASGQAPLQPTVAARTLDVSATGEAGLDWANIGAPTTTVDLSGTTVKNVDNAIANVTLVATTTNLTNAPTAGDFTAVMKTSLNAATPASVTGAVGSVTGNVGGNVTGSVGSVLGNVAGSVASVVGNVGGNVVGSVGSVLGNVAGSVASVVGNVGGNLVGSIGDITAAALARFFTRDSGQVYSGAVAGSVVYEIGSNSGSPAAVADAVWDELLAGHAIPGSAGAELTSAASGGSAPTVQQIVDGVWDEPNADHLDAGSTGYNLSLLPTIEAQTSLITSDNVTIANPVNPNTLGLTLYNQNDYQPTSGAALPTWTSAGWSVYGLQTAASITLYWGDENSTIDEPLGTIVVDSATSIHLTVEHADVFALPLGASVAAYKIIAVLDGAHGDDTVMLVNAALSHYNYLLFPTSPNTEPSP